MLRLLGFVGGFSTADSVGKVGAMQHDHADVSGGGPPPPPDEQAVPLAAYAVLSPAIMWRYVVAAGAGVLLAAAASVLFQPGWMGSHLKEVRSGSGHAEDETVGARGDALQVQAPLPSCKLRRDTVC